MLRPLVTVVMTVFNSECYLHDAIESILNQTYPNLELIIVDDGSSDKSLDIINSFDDNRIKLICNEINRGQAYSRNEAIKLAQGTYIAIMDSDDLALPDRISVQVEYLEKNTDKSMCCSWAEIINEYSQIIGIKRTSLDENVLKLNLLFECPIIHPTVMWRRSDFTVHNLWYDEFFVYAQDYDLWCRALQFVNIGVIPKALLKFRFHHPKSVSVEKRDEQIYFAHIIQKRNIQKVIRIADYNINNKSLISKVLLYRQLIASDFLVVDKQVKKDYFRKRLFDKMNMPHTLKSVLRKLLVN